MQTIFKFTLRKLWRKFNNAIVGIVVVVGEKAFENTNKCNYLKRSTSRQWSNESKWAILVLSFSFRKGKLWKGHLWSFTHSLSQSLVPSLARQQLWHCTVISLKMTTTCKREFLSSYSPSSSSSSWEVFTSANQMAESSCREDNNEKCVHLTVPAEYAWCTFREEISAIPFSWAKLFTCSFLLEIFMSLNTKLFELTKQSSHCSNADEKEGTDERQIGESKSREIKTAEMRVFTCARNRVTLN